MTKNSKNREWALKMIPVLIRWAMGSWDQLHFYSDLSKAVGHKTNQIGSVMGTIQDMLDEVSKKINKTKDIKKKIPTLNALVANKGNKLPSEGLDYVIDGYSKLSNASKSGEIKKLNKEAHQYNWDRVLRELGLVLAKDFSDEDIKRISNMTYYGTGEGEGHKKLKEFVKEHPESVNITNVIQSETEHGLLSGDSLDVYFVLKNGNRVAVEVKSASSLDQDVTRGIFQCVKYKAVMDASRSLDYGKYDNQTLLVIEGTISEKNRQLAIDLSIDYMDDFKKY